MLHKVTAVVISFLLLSACSSVPDDPSGAPTTTSTNASQSTFDNMEVFDTGCDVPHKTETRQESTGVVGQYKAKLEVRTSTVPGCENLYWLRLRPIEPPDKYFAAVLRTSDVVGGSLQDVAVQNARPSDPKVEAITKGRMLEPGQEVRGCLVRLGTEGELLTGQFSCTDGYAVP